MNPPAKSDRNSEIMDLKRKLIILDAGGVIQPDSELGLPNQSSLQKLTGLTAQELNQYQDHEKLNKGEISLENVFQNIIQVSNHSHSLTLDILLSTYKKNISLYPGAVKLICDIEKTGYRVVILTNNSNVGFQHTKDLFLKESLSHIPIYGSSELGMKKPDQDIFLKVCEKEKVHPNECWFIDDREINRKAAEKLGMSVIAFDRLGNNSEALNAINGCRNTLLQLGILNK